MTATSRRRARSAPRCGHERPRRDPAEATSTPLRSAAVARYPAQAPLADLATGTHVPAISPARDRPAREDCARGLGVVIDVDDAFAQIEEAARVALAGAPETRDVLHQAVLTGLDGAHEPVRRLARGRTASGGAARDPSSTIQAGSSSTRSVTSGPDVSDRTTTCTRWHSTSSVAGVMRARMPLTAHSPSRSTSCERSRRLTQRVRAPPSPPMLVTWPARPESTPATRSSEAACCAVSACDRPRGELRGVTARLTTTLNGQEAPLEPLPLCLQPSPCRLVHERVRSACSTKRSARAV